MGFSTSDSDLSLEVEKRYYQLAKVDHEAALLLDLLALFCDIGLVPVEMIKILYDVTNKEKQVDPLRCLEILAKWRFIIVEGEYFRLPVFVRDTITDMNIFSGDVPKQVKFLLLQFLELLENYRDHKDFKLMKQHMLFFEKRINSSRQFVRLCCMTPLQQFRAIMHYEYLTFWICPSCAKD